MPCGITCLEGIALHSDCPHVFTYTLTAKPYTLIQKVPRIVYIITVVYVPAVCEGGTESRYLARPTELVTGPVLAMRVTGVPDARNPATSIARLSHVLDSDIEAVWLIACDERMRYSHPRSGVVCDKVAAAPAMFPAEKVMLKLAYVMHARTISLLSDVDQAFDVAVADEL